MGEGVEEVDDSDANENGSIGKPGDDDNKVRGPKAQKTKKGKNVSRLLIGGTGGADGFMDLPTTALFGVAQVEKNVTVGIGTRGAHTVISWKFPSFDKLVYDPTVVSDPAGADTASYATPTASNNDDDDDNVLICILAIGGGLVLIGLIVGAVLYSRRHKNASPKQASAAAQDVEAPAAASAVPVAAAAPAANANDPSMYSQ